MIAGSGHHRIRFEGLAVALFFALTAACARTQTPGGNPGAGVATDDIPGLSKLLAEGRLSGRVHAAVHDRGLYVFTYYPNPKNFFRSTNFPLRPASAAVARRLAQIKRHDGISLKGGFIEHLAPIRHIRLDDFQITKVYTADEIVPRRELTTRIPEDLPAAGAGGRVLIGKVHAVAEDGRILVIEYGDAVVPVLVAAPKLTAGLFRNDKIRVAFTVSDHPSRPRHLWLDTAHPRPLEVLERLADRSGKPFEAEGVLVRYPRSPQIIVDVYALQVVDADNVSRDYTLLNEDLEIFKAIREKLGKAWRSRPARAVDGRNKLVNSSIRVRAKGTFNQVARNQANGQILLASPDDLTITLLPEPPAAAVTAR